MHPKKKTKKSARKFKKRQFQNVLLFWTISFMRCKQKMQRCKQKKTVSIVYTYTVRNKNVEMRSAQILCALWFDPKKRAKIKTAVATRQLRNFCLGPLLIRASKNKKCNRNKLSHKHQKEKVEAKVSRTMLHKTLLLSFQIMPKIKRNM